MKRARIQIRSDTDAVLSENLARAAEAARTGVPSDPVATFTFSSPGQLFSVISPKRWALIEHLQKIGPSSIRALARALGRDVKRVHDDVTALAEWGIIERTADGKVEVPFDVIHADFDLRAVA
ncbi:transcriptional regulator [Shinella granuli]|jgi:predicted transcriptional regulator|uniref:Putative transcriptional regulator n=1 Tax=Shinella granuli TaxID=323621 RepID=A0A4R2D1S7_SHIGR|nr:transcriptional regulator [Shinella granuli]TCN47566.1 putative transcriptional regulator [Shinella granuli]